MPLPITFEKIQSDSFNRRPTVGQELETAFNENFDKINFELQDLKNQIGAAGYESFSIISFKSSVEFAERGSTVSSIKFDWAYNGNIVNQSISPDVPMLVATERTRTVIGLSIKNNREWTLRASDGVTEQTKTASLTFLDSMYYGASSKPSLSNTEILNELTSELAINFEQTRFFNCAGGKYIYFAWPSVWMNPIFRVGGVSFSAIEKTSVIGFPNASGAVLNLDVFRLQHKQSGSNIMIEVFRN